MYVSIENIIKYQLSYKTLDSIIIKLFEQFNNWILV